MKELWITLVSSSRSAANWVSSASPTSSLLYPWRQVRISFQVCQCTVDPRLDDEYEDTITLKDASRNAFIGLGYKSVPVTTRRLVGSPVVLMPALGGLLGVDVVEPASVAGSR
jgi:hypothetical protein